MNIRLNYTYKPVAFIVNLQQISGLYTALNDFNTESYFILNADVNYVVTDFMRIFLKGENLLNKNYQIDFGYPMPGRSVMLGINFEH